MKRTIFFLLVLCSVMLFGEETEQKEKTKKGHDQWFVFNLSKQDMILPITSIEWGSPDRLSTTSRYIHFFEKERNDKTWLNSAGVLLSPGISGGRIGINYLGIYSPSSPKLRGFALFTELRGVLLRTWENPLTTSSNTTFAGAEVKICLVFLLNVSAGYYSPITNKNTNPFLGFHIGVGI